MKNRFKALLSVLIALVVTFSVFPGSVVVMAAEETDKDFVFEIKSKSVNGENVEFAVMTDYTGSSDEIVVPAETNGIPVTRITGCPTPAGVKTIVIPDSVTSISDVAFPNCEFRKFATGNGLTGLPYALIDADVLESAVIGDGITDIYNVAFRNCKNLKEVILGKSIANIGVSAFKNCTSLENLTLPSSLEKIDEYAFLNCVNLRSVTVSSNINTAANAFNSCSIEEVKLTENVSELPSVILNPESLKSVVLGDGFKEVPDIAFRNYKALTSVELSENIKRIGVSAFRNCSSLEKINIPENVETISEYAFYGCSQLKAVDIPESVDCIKTYTFYNCFNLKTVRIPASVKNIDEKAFFFCDNLKYVYFGGSEEQWNSIDIKEQNQAFENAKVFFNIPQPEQLKKIEMLTSPDKVVYHKNEKFDSKGMTVQAVYSNTKFEIADYEITYDFSNVGTTYVTISVYENDRTVSLGFAVNVVEHFIKRETKASECEKDGYIRDVCEYCGDVINEIILPAKGHAQVEDKKNPTCHEAGYSKIICPNCGKVYVSVTMPKLNHEWTSWATIMEATYRSTGIQRRQCRICGDYQDREIPMKKIAATGIEMSMSEITMNYKQTTRLYANVIPEDAAFTSDVVWSSSNPKVATVDENGVVTATGRGTAVITASTENGRVKDVCNVNVKYSLVQEIIVYLLFGWIWY